VKVLEHCCNSACQADVVQAHIDAQEVTIKEQAKQIEELQGEIEDLGYDLMEANDR